MDSQPRFNFHATDTPGGLHAVITASDASQVDGLSFDVLPFMMVATMMLRQYNLSGGPFFLNLAISLWEQLSSRAPDSHPEKFVWLWTLAVLYLRRYAIKRDLGDLDKSIIFFRTSVDVAPDDYMDRADHLLRMGLIYIERHWQRSRQQTDIINAATFLEKALHASPEVSDLSVLLHHLISALASSYHYSGSTDYLDRAIEANRLALERLSDDAIQRYNFLGMQGLLLVLQFRHTGNWKDNDELDLLVRKAVGTNEKIYTKLALALSLSEGFRHSGKSSEIDQAVSILTELAESSAPEMQSCRDLCLASLYSALHHRYLQFMDPKDHDYAFATIQKLVQMNFYREKTGLADLFSDLASAHRERFELTKDPNDLDNAVAITCQAIESTPEGYWSEKSRLGDLGGLLRMRFISFGRTRDLEESHICYKRAVYNIPDDHQDRAKLLRYLGGSYTLRFVTTHQSEDITKAVDAHKAAIEATPKDHVERVPRLTDLGLALQLRSAIHQDVSGLDEAISAYTEAALSNKGLFDNQINASWLWGSAAFQRSLWTGMDEVIDGCPIDVDDTLGQMVQSVNRIGDEDEQSYRGFSRMMDLIPMAVWLGKTIAVRHDTLKSISEYIRKAADLICRQYKRSTTAVEWLEQGRSVVWRQQLNLRTRFDELQDMNPDLARRMRDVSISLDGASTRHGADPRHGEPRLDESGPPRRRLAEEWESLLLEARQVPGFERFLHPRQISELQKAARVGPIVILNMGMACHALLVLENRVDVLNVPLSLPLEQAEQLRTDMDELLMTSKVRSRLGLERRYRVRDNQEMLRILQCLWVNIVKPVLDALGLCMLERSEPHPRIIWCPTGPLAFLPIHAAGDYSRDESGHRISDYVVSSYTSTISALLDASNRDTSSELRCLTVSQSKTPGLSSLPCTEMEVCRVKQRVGPAKVKELNGEAATVAAVHDAMERCSWIHLACHAIQDETDPLKSAFRLADGDLQLQDIIRKTHPHADFAFLSACQTSTGDRKLSDEAVHLAAGLQLAGYRSLVATMWSIRDDDGPLVADEVYAHLLRDGKPDSSRAAHALHDAVLKLQETTKTEDRDDSWFLRWVPFIHIGV